jgi:hypothetical protein
MSVDAELPPLVLLPVLLLLLLVPLPKEVLLLLLVAPPVLLLLLFAVSLEDEQAAIQAKTVVPRIVTAKETGLLNMNASLSASGQDRVDAARAANETAVGPPAHRSPPRSPTARRRLV